MEGHAGESSTVVVIAGQEKLTDGHEIIALSCSGKQLCAVRICR